MNLHYPIAVKIVLHFATRLKIKLDCSGLRIATVEIQAQENSIVCEWWPKKIKIRAI